MVGRSIAMDLSNNFEVTSFDISEANLVILKERSNVQTVKANLGEYSNYASLLVGFDW
jgi:hypothetical protein